DDEVAACGSWPYRAAGLAHGFRDPRGGRYREVGEGGEIRGAQAGLSSRPRSNEHCTAVHDDDLTGNVALTHQVEIGLGNLLGLSDMSDWNPLRSPLVQRRTIRLGHLRP